MAHRGEESVAGEATGQLFMLHPQVGNREHTGSDDGLYNFKPIPKSIPLSLGSSTS